MNAHEMGEYSPAELAAMNRAPRIAPAYNHLHRMHDRGATVAEMAIEINYTEYFVRAWHTKAGLTPNRRTTNRSTP